MADRWMIRGVEYTNCNCNWGCPCQFNAPTTHGFCEAVAGGLIEEGHFNDVRLDGLHWVMLLQWPGEIAAGGGRQQAIIDERGSPAQREALRKILHGESTAPGASHFYVFNSTMSEVLAPIYAHVRVAVDVAARQGRIEVPGLVESQGSPIRDPFGGGEFHAAIHLPNGFEYTVAQVGCGTTRANAGLRIETSESYGQFNLLHMNQHGPIR